MRFDFLHFKKNFFLYVLIALFSFIFFYHLEYTTLESWDEAWYGSVAREILRTGDTMNLNWNGKPFFDHPPMGFWLMAASYKIFGVNEFATRLPSALAALLSIILIYKTAELLFRNKYIGFASALVLGTSVWYVLRARSGNLDSVFIFFYILTVYLSLKSSRSFRWFPLVGLSFGALMLSKTLAGISVLFLILFLNFKQLLRLRSNFQYVLFAVFFSAIITLPWYDLHLTKYSYFYNYHFINIGVRNRATDSYLDFGPAKQVMFYFHMGMRKWYYIWIASSLYLILRRKFLKKEVFLLLFWNLMMLFPFLSSAETQIWHLIPIFVPASLVIGYGTYDFGQLSALILRKTIAKRLKWTKSLTKSRIVNLYYLFGFILIATIQIRIFYNEVLPKYPYTPDNVKISRRLLHYDKRIFLDDDFFPISVFYSSKIIIPMYDLGSWNESDDKKTLVGLFKSDEQDFVAVTRNWAVDNLKNEGLEYVILEKNDSFSIVRKPNDDKE